MACMPTRTAPTKRAADKAPAKVPAKKAATTADFAKAKKAAAPAPIQNGEDNEPLIRIAFGAEDLERLIEKLDGWDDPVAHRLRLRYSKHRQRHVA